MADTASVSSWRSASTFVDKLRHSFSYAAPTQPERAQSRGRDVMSTGRGGAGNMRPASGSRDARPLDGPDDFSSTRGRELPPKHTVTHSGRGGAGNVRSPSRDPELERREMAKEHERIVRHLQEEEGLPHSSGRGGAGNISRSRSRGPAPTLAGTGTGTTTTTTTSATHPSPSTGKGGYGNIKHSGSAGYDLEAERQAAEEAKHHEGKTHFHLFSSGKGAPAGKEVGGEERVGKLA